jgi:hypothetical protein
VCRRGGGDTGKDDDTVIANKFQVRVDHGGGSEEQSTDVVNHLPWLLFLALLPVVHSFFLEKEHINIPTSSTSLLHVIIYYYK